MGPAGAVVSRGGLKLARQAASGGVTRITAEGGTREEYMSVRQIHAVWQLSKHGIVLTGAKQRVLLALADTANDDGLCWPGNDHIAAKCGISKRNVQRHKRELQAMGLLTAERRLGPDGRQTSNLYRLTLRGGESATPEKKSRGGESDTPEGRRKRHGGGGGTDTPGVAKPPPPIHVEPSVEPSRDPCKELTSRDVRTSGEAEASPPGKETNECATIEAERIFQTLWGRDWAKEPQAKEFAPLVYRVSMQIRRGQIPAATVLGFAGDVRDDYQAGKVRHRGAVFAGLLSQYWKRRAKGGDDE